MGTQLPTADAKVFKSRCIRILFIAQDCLDVSFASTDLGGHGAADNNFRRNLDKELHAATSEFRGIRCTQRCELRGVAQLRVKVQV